MDINSRWPLGIRLLRAGTDLEMVRSRGGTVALRVTEPGLELMECTLQAGERLTILPPSTAELSGTEVYYLLEGVLRADGVEALVLGAGDIIEARVLQEAVMFEVERTVRFLCLTTQPAFHEISGILNDLKRLADEVELKDKGAADHCQRIRDLALDMGRELGLSDSRLLLLDYGAYLHDVGKVEVPTDILLKPASLTDAEWEIVKQHPLYGRQLVENTFMKDAGPIIEQHHERFDGSGYPRGLAGRSILVESYIVAVADAFDAMTTDRPYRAAISRQEAIAEIERGSNRFYPTEVVEAFLSSLNGLPKR